MPGLVAVYSESHSALEERLVYLETVPYYPSAGERISRQVHVARSSDPVFPLSA